MDLSFATQCPSALALDLPIAPVGNSVLVGDGTCPYESSGQPPTWDVSNKLDAQSQRRIYLLRRIVVLRQLLAAGFTRSDLATTLPILCRLRDIKPAEDTDPDAAMLKEYRALLEASPEAPLPASSSEAINRAVHYCYEEQAKVWNDLLGKLTVAKTAVLRKLLGQEPQPFGGLVHSIPEVRTDILRTSRSQTGRLAGSEPTAEARRHGVGTPADAPPGARSGSGLLPPSPLISPVGKNASENQRDQALRADRDALRPPRLLSPGIVRISLADLIDLLQSKLDAMGRAQ